MGRDLGRIGRRIIRTVKILARVHVVRHPRGRRPARVGGEVGRGRRSQEGRRHLARRHRLLDGRPVGAVVGARGAARRSFPVPVVVAQHIAEGFVPGLVEWLASTCAIGVRAAVDGEELQPGTAYFAPTGANLRRRRGDRALRASARPGRSTSRRPTTCSRASPPSTAGTRSGVLLTGMGADGAKGLRAAARRGRHDHRPGRGELGRLGHAPRRRRGGRRRRGAPGLGHRARGVAAIVAAGR